MTPRKMHAARLRPMRDTQRGAALVVGLLFLILVTLLATVAMRQSITQERMAGGLRNASLARNGAETALRQGERRIFQYFLTSNGRALVGDTNWTQKVYLPSDSRSRAFRNYRGFTAANGLVYPTSMYDFTSTTTNPTAALSAQPTYTVTDLGRMRPVGAGLAGEGGATGKENYEGSGGGSPAGNSDVRIYRVVARSTGGLATVTRASESTYAARGKG